MEWMSKEKNKIHVARHIDLPQESSNMVPKRAEWTTSARCAVSRVPVCFCLAVRLLSGDLCVRTRGAERTDPGRKNRPLTRGEIRSKTGSAFCSTVEMCPNSFDTDGIFSVAALVGVFEVVVQAPSHSYESRLNPKTLHFSLHL